MKTYEGLFILSTVAKEEGIKEVIDKITTEIEEAGGKVQTVQKMDKRTFTRVANKRHTSGFYVNFIFQIEPSQLPALRGRFKMNDDVFRILFTEMSAAAAKVAA